MLHGVCAYRLNPVVRLSWVAWNDEYVVFDETSGQTHQMDPLRAYVLNALDGEAKRFQLLLDEVSGLAEQLGEAKVSELLAQVLQDFETHGLVEAVPQ